MRWNVHVHDISCHSNVLCVTLSKFVSFVSELRPLCVKKSGMTLSSICIFWKDSFPCALLASLLIFRLPRLSSMYLMYLLSSFYPITTPPDHVYICIHVRTGSQALRRTRRSALSRALLLHDMGNALARDTLFRTVSLLLFLHAGPSATGTRSPDSDSVTTAGNAFATCLTNADAGSCVLRFHSWSLFFLGLLHPLVMYVS